MSSRTKTLLILLAVAVLGIGLLQTPLLRTTRHTLWSGLVATTGRWWNVGFLSFDAGYTDQLAQLRIENIRLKGELHDYVQLRQQLQQPSLESLRTIEALVAGAPLDVFRTHVLLNKGALDGVTIGAPVVTAGSTLIGFISELDEHTAVCRLLFHPETSLPAEIPEAEFARGLLTGHLYTSLLLTTIPRDAHIREGQPVVTVGQELTPPALLVGIVERVYSAENEAYQQARLKVPFAPDALRAVTIIVQP